MALSIDWMRQISRLTLSDSVKGTVHGCSDDVESSFTNLEAAQEELGERQKVLKAELRDELLHELTVSIKSTLRPTAPPCIPSMESPLGDGGASPSASDGPEVDSAGRNESTPRSGESGAEGAATDATTEERGSTSTHREVLQSLLQVWYRSQFPSPAS